MTSNKKGILILSFFFSLLVLMYQFFKWTITNALGPLLSLFLWWFILGFFIVMTIFAIVYILKRKRWMPLTINLVTLLLLFVIPFTEVSITKNFKVHQAKREEVVKLVEDGILEPTNRDTTIIHLPKKYRSLSEDGLIVLNKSRGKTSILFLTYRGILDNFSGFVYSPSNSKPSQGDFYGHFTEIIKIRDHWFFVRSK
jgi:hypothetical protein